MIDHDKRKEQILANALSLFASQGYDAVTYQKIAERCGLTRTTLYTYYKNKREIFDAAILRVTRGIQMEYREILAKPVSVAEQLEEIMSVTFEMLYQQRILLTVILRYLLNLKRTGEKVNRRITRHTFRARRLFAVLIMRGVENGEFEPVNIASAADTLYSQLEAFIFQLTVTERADTEKSMESVKILIQGFKKEAK